MSGALAGPPQIDPAEPVLLHDPLGFFIAEHFRQRQLLNSIDWLAQSTALDRNLAAAVVAFLRRDLPLHIEDEEQDLFPLLRRRCSAEDDIDAVLSELTAEHAGHRRQASRLIRGLEKALADGRCPASYRGLGKLMGDFALGERRHLALENAVVLPLARRRLKGRDLQALSASMTKRHGADSSAQAAAEQADRTPPST